MKENISQIVQILKKLNYILNKKQKKKALFVLLIIMISSGFELIGVTAVLPFIQAVLTPDILMRNRVVKAAMDFLSIQSSSGLLALMGGMLILLYLTKNSFMVFSQFVQANYATRVQKELSVKMLRSYMSRPYTYFLDVNSAEILRGCAGDIGSVYSILSYLMTILTECLSVISIGAFIIYTDPFIAVGVLALMAVVLLGIILLFKPKIKKAGRENVLADRRKNKAINQSVAGIKEIYVMQRKELFVKEYEEANEISRRAQRIYDTLNNSPDRIVEGICVSGIIGIVCIRLLMNDTSTMEFIPKLGAFAMAAFKIFPSIGKLANRMNAIIYHLPGFHNVYDNMREAELYEKERQKYVEEHKNEKMTADSGKDVDFENDIAVRHVEWKYGKAKAPVLKDACMTIRKGEAIAFIGASGAGKTTLADVILGLLHPQSGSVEMDGTDIYTIPGEWAHIVGYVPQSVFLTDDTVRNNIAFGIPQELVTDEDIWDALERAQLADFIRSLPDGLDAVVGERGIKFSGGQKQRIAIARALYNKPEVLILDEATAALDNETETAVMESIDALQGQITLIIVAHRLTTIRNCDKVYEIKDGVVLERKKEEVLAGI